MAFGLDLAQFKSHCLNRRARKLHLGNRVATVQRRVCYIAVDNGSWRRRFFHFRTESRSCLAWPFSPYRTVPKAHTVTSVLSIWLAQISLKHGRGGMKAKRGLGWRSASSPKNLIRDSQRSIGNGNESRLPHVEPRIQIQSQILKVRLAGRKWFI